MKKLLLFLMVAAVYLLHQDYWNWLSQGWFFKSQPIWLKGLIDSLLFINPDTGLVFGFVPVGLAYHAGYSILAAVMMAVLVKFAWPKHLENVEPLDPAADKSGEEGH